MIGSKGVYLSGGEKQRIAIARAMLKNAKIVILDEASAAIDPENEHELQKAFAHLNEGKDCHDDCTSAVQHSKCG